MGTVAERLDMAEVQYERFRRALLAYQAVPVGQRVGALLDVRGELHLLLVLIHRVIDTSFRTQGRLAWKIPGRVKRMRDHLRNMRDHLEHIDQRAVGNMPKHNPMTLPQLHQAFGYVDPDNPDRMAFGVDVLDFRTIPLVMNDLQKMFRLWFQSR